MATGDISVVIEPNGWVADLTIQGFTTGATYNFGTTTVGNAKNVPTASTPFLTLTSLGFDDTGSPITVARQIYLTRQLRFPYSSVSLPTSVGAGTFTDGETVTQATSGATGVIVGNQPSGTILYFKNVTGVFDSTHLLTGGTSGATATSTGTITTLTMPTNAEQVIGGNLLVRVALSDYVYWRDDAGTGATGTVTRSGTTVGTIAVGTAGTGFTKVPSVAIIPGSDGSGSGALAHATLSGSGVATIVVDAAGTGYNTTPTVSINNSGTAPTFTAPSGFIVNSGGASQSSNVASAIALTQSSTAAYQPSIISWAWPDSQLVQGSTMPLKALAFHNSAQLGRPVRCVKFTVSDAHSHTQTFTSLTPAYDATVGDANPVIEHTANISTSTFTALDTLTANFTAYPWVGDLASASTTTGGTAPSPNPAPQTYLCDTAQTYGQAAARVNSTSTITGTYTSGTFTAGETVTQTTSGATAKIVGSGQSSGTTLLVTAVTGTPSATGAQTWVGGTSSAIFAPSSLPVVNGNDSTGIVTTLAAYTPTQAAYATIAAAWTAIVTYNTSHGSNHADAGGSFVFCDNSYYALGGSSGTAAVWATLTANTANGATQAGVIINSSGGTGFSSKTHPVGISFNTSGTSLFNGGSYLWADKCAFHCNDVATVFNMGWTAFTRCSFTQMGSGLAPFSTTNAPFALIRGNNLNGLQFATIQWYTVVGNLKTAVDGSNSFNITAGVSGTTTVAASNPICAFNKMLGMWVVNPVIGGLGAPSVGAAIVQNLIENVSSSNQLGIQLAADSSSGTTASNNVLLWNNTVSGCRCNLGYNDFGTSAPPRVYWSDVNNFWEMAAHKTDTFNANPSPSGSRIGNWPLMWGVGFSGTYDGETTGFAATASFLLEYYGTNVFYPPLTYTTNPVTSVSPGSFNAAKFSSDLATNGSTNGTGGGTYTLTTGTPLAGLQLRQVLPFDLAGNPRSAVGAAGAYQYPPLSGVGFWWM